MKRLIAAGAVAVLLLFAVMLLAYIETFDMNFTSALFASSNHHEIIAGGEFCSSPVRFLHANESRSRPVALASFPGSGNTWLRFLIEQGMRKFTGSVYEDEDFANAFGGEGSSNANTTCVKTHFPCPKCWTYQHCKGCAGSKPVTSAMTGPIPQANANIYLVRSPFDSFVAEFNRIRTGEHSGTLGPNAFTATPKRKSYETEYDKPTWNQFIAHRLPAYVESVEFYLGGGRQSVDDGVYVDASGKLAPTKLVFYERLKANPQVELKKIFRFLIQLYVDEGKPETFPEKAEEYAECSMQHNALTRFEFQRNKSRIYNPWLPAQVQLVCDTLGEAYWFSKVWGNCSEGLLQVQKEIYID